MPTMGYDRNAQCLMEAVQSVPMQGDPPLAPGSLLFERGDKIELISSTRTCALAEDEPCLAWLHPESSQLQGAWVWETLRAAGLLLF